MNILFGRAPILYDKELVSWFRKIAPEHNIQWSKNPFLLNIPWVFLKMGKKICHINGPNQLPLAYVYKKLFGAKIVYSSHGNPKPRTIKLQKGLFQIFKYSLYVSIFRRLYKHIDQYIACSQYIKKEIKHLYDIDSIVVYYGINRKKFYPTNDIQAAKKKISDKENIILSVARFTPYKDPITLIKALAFLKEKMDFEAIFINGSGSAPLYPEMVEKIKELELEDHIRLIPGKIPQQQLRSYLQGSDILVLPSISEAFGTVTSEAIGCGTPVIVSNLGGPRDVVDNAGLHFRILNPKDLYEKLYNYLENTELQNELRKNALKRAASLTWKGAAEELLEIYKEI